MSRVSGGFCARTTSLTYSIGCFGLIFALATLPSGMSAAEIGGMTYAVDTTLSDGDFWTAGNITINPGITVDVPGAATVTFNAGAKTLNGGGSFLNSTGGFLTLSGAVDITLDGTNITNDGTTNWLSGNSNKLFRGTGQFINNGTFNHAHGGSSDNVEFFNSVAFVNSASGTLDFQDQGDLRLHDAANFLNSGLVLNSGAGGDPSFIFSTAGTTGGFANLAGAEVRSEAGLLTVSTGGTSDAGSLWNALNGDIQISGFNEWSGTFNGTATGSGNVQIRDNGNGTVADNLIVGPGNIIFNITGNGVEWSAGQIFTQGNTVTNTGVFEVDTGGTVVLSDAGGELINGAGGTFNHIDGSLSLSNGTILRNQGTLNYNGGDGKGYSGTGGVINEVGATANLNGSGSLTLNISGVAFENDGQFNWNSSATLSLAQADTVLQNDGDFLVTGSGNRALSGTGTFINNGTFTHAPTDTGNDNLQGVTSGGTFINNGTFDIASRGDFELRDGYTFTNNGLLVKSADSNADPAQFFSFSAQPGAGTFDNQGEVRVEVGTFRITTSAADAQFDDVTLSQVSGTTLTGGTWTILDNATLDLQPISAGVETIGSGATVNLSGPGALFVQMNSNGTNSLATLQGTLNLTDNHVFTTGGDLTIDGGTISGDNTGGTLQLGGNLLVANSANGGISGGIVDLGGAIRTIDVAGGGSLEIASVVQGAGGGITKLNDGTLTLLSDNTFDGGATLGNGTNQSNNLTRIGHNDALGDGPITFLGARLTSVGGTARTIDNQVTFGPGGGSSAFLGSGADPGSLTFTGPIDLDNGGRTLQINANVELAGAISDGPGAGAGGINKSGGSILTLSNSANSFTGPLNVNQGRVDINASGAQGNGNVVLTTTNTQLRLANGVDVDSTLIVNNGGNNKVLRVAPGGSATYSGNITTNETGGGAFLGDFDVLAGVNDTLTLSGVISGGGKLNAVNDGTIIFDGSAANTFGTFILGDGGVSSFDGASGNKHGFVVVNRSDALGSGNIVSRGSQLQAGVAGINVPNNIIVEGGGLRFGGSNSFELSGDITIENSTRGISNYGLDGVTVTLSGNIDLDDNGSPRNILFQGSNGKNNGEFIVSGVISDGAVNATVTVDGNFDNGDVFFTGNNTYSGTTTISAGTLHIGDGGTSGTVGDGTGNVVNNSALIFNRSDNHTVANNISGSGTVTQDGTGTVRIEGDNSYGGVTNINFGILEAASNTALGGTGNGTVVATGARLALDGGVSIGSEALTISGSGAGGGGALRSLSGGNTYGGPITLAADATITAADSSLTLTNTVNNAGNQLTLNANSGRTMNVDGVVSGGGDVVKGNAGILRLRNAANTYTGNTIINAGELELDATSTSNNIAGSPIISVGNTAQLDVTGLSGGELILANGQTLIGSGTVTGNLTIGNVGGGALHSPGFSIATQTITGNYLLNSGNTLLIEIGGTAGAGVDPNGHDSLNVNGATATFNGTIDVNLTNSFVPADQNSFDLVGGTAAIAGPGSLNFAGPPSWDFSDAILGPGLAWNTQDFLNTGTIGIGSEGSIWDANNVAAGSGNTGGLWSDQSWTNNAAGTGFTGFYDDNTIAIFSAGNDGVGPFTVGVDSAVNVMGINFEEGSGTVTLGDSGGSLNLTGAMIDVAGGVTGSIEADVTGNTGFNKTGGGTLNLSGSNGFTGGNAAVAGGTLNVTGGSISGVLDLVVAQNTSAAYNQTGGTVTANNNIEMANGAGGNATATLSNGSLTAGNRLIVGGAGGTANFTQSGGSLTTNTTSGTGPTGEWSFIGVGGGSSGTYNITGGSLDTSAGTLLAIGQAGGTGVLNQDTSTGASTVTTRELWIGWNGGSNGAYNLTDGTLNVNDRLGIGRDGGTGLFNQDGGTVNVAGTTFVASGGGTTSGTLDISGGVFNANNNVLIGDGVGKTGTLNISGGTLNQINNDFIVGFDGGTGTVNQTGGTVNTNLANSGSGDPLPNNWTFIGRDSGSVGTYNISGGTLDADNSTLVAIGQNGGTGTLNQSGTSTVEARELWIGWNGGSNGTYNMSGGNLNVDDRLGIGRSGGTGEFNLDAGTVNVVNSVYVGSDGGSDGTLNVNGGTLNQTGANGDFIVGFNGGTGTVNQTGGTVSTNQANAGNGAPLPNSWTFIGRDGGSSGTYNISGGTLDANNSTLVAIGQNGGTGVLNQSTTDGASTVLARELWIGWNGGSSGTYNLTDGTLTADGNLGIGRQGGTGLFNQDGGTVTASSNVLLGDNGSTGVGTYDISGGTLSVGIDLVVGGEASGNLIVSGGTVTTPDLIVGRSATGVGSVIQSGGTINVTGTSTYTVGLLGMGDVDQSGGVTNVGNPVGGGDMLIGDSAGTGVYTLHGTGVLNNYGNMTVGNNGTFNLQDDGFLNFGDTHPTTQSTTAPTTLFASTLEVTGNGTFNFDGGTLQNVSFIDMTAANDSTFAQNDGRFVIGVDGMLAIDGSAQRAITEIENGNFNQAASGELFIDIFGPGSHGGNGEQGGILTINPLDPDLDSDLLYVSGDPTQGLGNALLAGTLNINLNGYEPAPFHWYDVLLADGEITTEDTFMVDGVNFWRVIDNPAGPGQLLQVAVPEPASVALWTLLGLALAGFGWCRFRWKTR